MKLYMACILQNMTSYKIPMEIIKKNKYFLESFYALGKWERHIGSIDLSGDGFMLDSGAFTLLNSGDKSKIKNLDKYITDYINFIKAHKIKLYVEMDIDKMIGLAEVERLRGQMYRETGVLPIPVWHRHLGKEYFEQLCKDYPYVSIGVGQFKDTHLSHAYRIKFCRGLRTPPIGTVHRYTGWHLPLVAFCAILTSTP